MPGRFQGLQALNGLVRAQRASTAVDTPREVITREGLEQAAREEFADRRQRAARRRKTAGFPTAISLDPDFTGAGQMPRKQAEGAMDAITDFAPGIGDAKDISRAVQDPSLLNVSIAGLAAFGGPVGDIAKRGLKSTAKNVVVNKAEREAAEKMSEPELRKIVYQGSPHKFAPEPGYPMGRPKDEFIGTGAGHQIRGHGHYASESLPRAETYRPGRSTDPKFSITTPSGRAATEAEEAAVKYGGQADLDKAIGLIENLQINSPMLVNKEHLEILKGLRDEGATAKTGYVYEMMLKAADEDFLLWDLPLSQQSDKIKELWKATGHGAGSSGQTIYEELAAEMGQKGASEYLKKRGVRGVKYLDEGAKLIRARSGSRAIVPGSRGAGEGPHGFVVFDPKDLEILRILGITGAVAGGASQIPQRAQNGPQS